MMPLARCRLLASRWRRNAEELCCRCRVAVRAVIEKPLLENSSVRSVSSSIAGGPPRDTRHKHTTSSFLPYARTKHAEEESAV